MTGVRFYQIRRHRRRQRILDGFKAAALTTSLLVVVVGIAISIGLFSFWLTPLLVEFVRIVLWDHHQ